ncbi:MAG: helix-turn-helix transcriptional regulator [Beijerinckiaceae bacterium]|nr:helix-turn-helix transcriptional regulator [Beijerinckiaceae bacterium]
MKIDDKTRGELVAEIQQRAADLGLSYSDIGRSANVDVSQVSRVCRGQFKTVSQNVVQICKALGLRMEAPQEGVPTSDPHFQRLQKGLYKLWDQTPEDADRLFQLLMQLAEIRRAANSKGATNR